MTKNVGTKVMHTWMGENARSRLKGLYLALRNALLILIGHLQVGRWPFFVHYNPTPFPAITGRQVRELMDLLQPGDLILRGYSDHLDGKLIPGRFSHVGLYVGPVSETDRLGKQNGFYIGEQVVVHAMARGVFSEDLIDYLRCEQVRVLRLPERLQLPPREASREHSGSVVEDLLPEGMPHFGRALLAEERAILAELRAGRQVDSHRVKTVMCRLGLGEIGRPYDFDFRFDSANAFSCTKLAYWVLRCAHPVLNLHPQSRHLLRIYRKRVVVPDDFIDVLNTVWDSAGLKDMGSQQAVSNARGVGWLSTGNATS